MNTLGLGSLDLPSTEVEATETPTSPSLATLPEELVTRICEESGYRAITQLRLVNHTLLKFINEGKVGYRLDKIFIEIGLKRITMTLTQNKEEHRILYKEQQFGGTQIISGPSDRRCVQVVNHDYSKVCLEELKRILTRQVGILKKLRINSVPHDKKTEEMFARRFENTFRRIVEKRNSKIKIQYIHFEIIEYLAIRIFQFLDSGALKKIGFSSSPGPFYNPNPEMVFTTADPLENKELMETEQWKKAEELFSFQLTFQNIPLKMFTHFSWLDVNLARVSVEDLMLLKKTYSNSTNFKHAIIHVAYYMDTVSMVDAFEEPFKVNEDAREWYFKCSDRGSALYLYLTKKLLKFVRCPVTAVPKGCRMSE